MLLKRVFEFVILLCSENVLVLFDVKLFKYKDIFVGEIL